MRRLPSGLRLLVSTGLVAAITAIGGLAAALIAQQGGGTQRRCELAAAYLQDETPNPYLTSRERQLAAHDAVARFRRCMRE